VDEKATSVRAMFARLAGRYDAANDLISMGQHRAWKRRAVALAAAPAGGYVLDLCTGTGDLAILHALRADTPAAIIGADFCPPMLAVARRRRKTLHPSAAPILLVNARAEQLPLPEDAFDVCTVAFGLRNVSDLDASLREIWRVLRPGGRLVSLDVSTPDNPLLRWAHALYFLRIMPLLGALVNRSREDYLYLPASAAIFPQKHRMCERMIAAGFSTAQYHQIFAGAAAIHVAQKG
jgi:demethylmenaquinone methyltransferase/2-methoxy-6-polyprenyl-1,4-benzoquinol methylase